MAHSHWRVWDSLVKGLFTTEKGWETQSHYHPQILNWVERCLPKIHGLPRTNDVNLFGKRSIIGIIKLT